MLKNPMCELAIISLATVSPTEVRADSARVVVAAGISAAGLLAGMGKGAVSPVVAPAASASPDLELVDAEVVGGVGVVRFFVAGRGVAG